MKSRLFVVTVLTSCVAAACGGEEPAPKAPVAERPRADDDVQESQENTASIPSKCLDRKGACMPPIRWAERLCEDVYEDLALYMFRKGTPYTRYYMRIGLNAVNGWGPTIDENLVTGEEVLVVNHRLRRDTVQVEGSEGTYDVLRWNGACVTLDMNRVTKRKPSRVRNARIDWRSLDSRYQDLILADSDVAEAHERRRKACKGASVGRATGDCQALDGEFLEAVANYVRQTEELPQPNKFPAK